MVETGEIMADRIYTEAGKAVAEEGQVLMIA